MDKRLTVSGQRLEPRLDGVVEWSRGELGELTFGPEEATFKDWSIPYEAISDAVLNTERILLKEVQSLAIDAETGKYLFTLHTPLAQAADFPFSVRITEQRSTLGKLVLFGIVLALAKLLWDFFTRPL